MYIVCKFCGRSEEKMSSWNGGSKLTTPLLQKEEIEFSGIKDIFNIVRELSSFVDKLAKVVAGWCFEGSTKSSCEFANTLALCKSWVFTNFHIIWLSTDYLLVW